MKRFAFFLFWISLLQISIAQSVKTPDEIYGELFKDVQLSQIFPDNKTFVDCIPKRDPAAIVKDYKEIKANPAIRFSLKLFIEENFIVPVQAGADFKTQEVNIVTHINNLWQVLKRNNDSAIKGSSLLPLPYPYIVPGGRFREIYYWDSYFTMLGLKESGEGELIENMINNFAYLIDTYGHIPNGNRTYYVSRSQPPFFSMMVALLSTIKGDDVYKKYLPQMQKEYNYWMDKSAPTRHVVHMYDGSVLNRYYDQLNKPRQESYMQDVETASKATAQNRETIYRHLRSGAESGWDFSSRWFKDGENISTIETTNIIPVDLNCLLYELERNIAKGYSLTGNDSQSQQYESLAQKRKAAIKKFFWSVADGWYQDYNIVTKKHTGQLTLAGVVPFFLNVADANHIYVSSHNIKYKFLKPGGVVTTLKNTGQQWDSPNGWAPLEWMTVAGLDNYNQKELAKEVAQRWVQLNINVYKRTGKLMEKYNVTDTTLEAGGGEYPSQDGFGWSNGVLLHMLKKYSLSF